MEAMHQDFGDWYRAKKIEPNSDTLPRRWAGVVANKSSSGDDIVSLTRIFYSLGKPSDEFLNAFRKFFHDADPAFPMKGNDQELVVLAGASLVHLIEHCPKKIACMAALSLVAAGAQNLRKAPPIPDIVEIAVKYLNESTINRSTEDESDEKFEAHKAACAKIKVQGEPWADFATAFEDLLAEHRSVSLRLPLVAEESNMLWWLFSEYSRELNQPLAKIGLPTCALVTGKELSDLTLALPGPIAAPAFLDRAIRRSATKAHAKIAVKDSLVEAPIEWRQKMASQSLPSELLDLMPITNGIRVSVSAPGDTWLSAFQQAVGFSADEKINPHELAYQIYLESLLCRAWASLK